MDPTLDFISRRQQHRCKRMQAPGKIRVAHAFLFGNMYFWYEQMTIWLVGKGFSSWKTDSGLSNATGNISKSEFGHAIDTPNCDLKVNNWYESEIKWLSILILVKVYWLLLSPLKFYFPQSSEQISVSPFLNTIINLMIIIVTKLSTEIEI